MDKQQARNLIRETFENPFNKARFNTFIKNLLNRIEEAPFTYQGQFIPEAYRRYISTLERIGKFNDGENRIDVLIIKLQRETSLERARTNQRNFVAGYLQGKYGSSNEKEAALVAFVSPDNADWRFSLVKMDYRFEQTPTGKIKVKEEFTPARRWSFLVGVNEKSHTAQSRLVPILSDDMHNPSLAGLEEAFNIETVTKEFFLKYRDLFIRTKEALDKVVKKDARIKADFEAKDVNTVDFAKKLLGQIVFLYFLQKKGWFGAGRDADWGDGSKQFLRELFEKKHGSYNNFFNDILEPLFYEALRNDRSHDDDYYSRFNCKIPFLNGGLFDPLANYDWVHTDIHLPDGLFSNKNQTREGDIGDGILDIFDRYNFTVKEDEPLEKEVAIDPELLGKAYEKFNAIRPDNFEEYKNALKSGKRGDETKFNKQFGVYYTPREIVHYMCQQSLINYLATEVVGADGNPPISKEDIETLIHLGEQVGQNEEIALIKEQKILEGKQKSSDYKLKLPESFRNNAGLIDQKLADITVCDPGVGSGAFPVGMMSEIVKARNVLSTFIEDENRKAYDFKRQCIEHCLYGVDIDPGAVEIAKLRLWLSLVVDEEDIKNIKPLPNLDYKIVCGNSLMGLPDGVLINDEISKKLEENKNLYFNSTNPSEKNKIRCVINDLFLKLIDSMKEFDPSIQDINFDFHTHFSEVFHQKGGFDVVIGNPPYVEHKKLKGISSELKKYYSAYSGTADLYVYFYEKGLKILRDRGSLVFITSNKFTKTSYGENLRNYFVNFRINEIVDFTEVHVFEALVASCIFSISKNNSTNNKIKMAFANDSLLDFSGVSEFVDKNKFFLPQKKLSEKIWQLENETKLSLKEKIEGGSVSLKETGTINIYRGVTTGYNPAFIIDEDKEKQLIKEDKANKAIIKPLLQGRNIRKWSYIKTTDYLIFTRRGISIKDYPIIKQHLQRFKQQLEPGVGRKSGAYNWYEIQDNTAYYPEFEKEKIIWGLTADKWAFAYDKDNHFLPSNGYILTSKETPVKYLLALMNSKLMEFYFGFIGIMTAGGAFTLKHETVSEFPIKLVDRKEQNKYIELVDKIFSLIQSDDYLQNAATQAKVKEYENQINQLVYWLYGLTEEEINIVEGGDENAR